VLIFTIDRPSQPEAKSLDQSNQPIPSSTAKSNIHAHQNENPYNLEEGSAVQYGTPPQYGVIKWIGIFPHHREVMFAGIDMVSYYMHAIHTYSYL